jgi:Zn-dependent protease with chaperone function
VQTITPNAVLFDGLSAVGQAVEVALRLDVCDVRLLDGTVLASWAVTSLIRTDIDAPGDSATFRWRGGMERLAIADKALLAKMRAASADLGASRSGGKRRRLLALLAGGTVGIAAIVLLIDRLPVLVAPFVPRAIERVWSDGMETTMVGNGRVCTAPLGTDALSLLMKKLSTAAGLPAVPRITVIDAATVNAFTLPDGRIVLMRGLIDTAADPDELAGVLAHELGHALHHDPARGMIRHLEVSFVTTSLGFGGGFAGAITELSYGRDAEFAADASALRTLQSAGLRADGLGRFLARLPNNGFEAGLFAVFSDHPASAARVARLRTPPTGVMALDAAAWENVKSICARPTDGSL